ncbi:hypothetical protein DPMN_096233 [Dreissena polymorpha]|uniref:Uncharacterized protein n=2 Tax=Dreissena polymorpha TaxID=45954 RepID=A0A9D4L8T5_DREPO|nr:hypothetical protein DPMN_096233 [Dreissena polymorpha]
MVIQFSSTIDSVIKTYIPKAKDGIDFQNQELLVDGIQQITEQTETLKEVTNRTKSRYMDIKRSAHEQCTAIRLHSDKVRAKVAIPLKQIEDDLEGLENIQTSEVLLTYPCKQTEQTIQDKGWKSSRATSRPYPMRQLQIIVNALLWPLSRILGSLFLLLPSRMRLQISSAMDLCTNTWVAIKGKCRTVIRFTIGKLSRVKETTHQNCQNDAEENSQLGTTGDTYNNTIAKRNDLLNKQARLNELIINADPSYIQKALEQIGNVIKQLRDIELYWVDTINQLNVLRQRCYSWMTDDIADAEGLKDSFSKLEKEFQSIFEGFRDYIQVASREVSTLFKFRF